MIAIPDAHNFQLVRLSLRLAMRQAERVPQMRWQGRDVSNDPSARVYELQNVCFEVDLHGQEDLAHWRTDIEPNLSWADDHFAERVSGCPLNPGTEWKNWPWAPSADTFRKGETFNHTYMERLWPRFARQSEGGQFERCDWIRGLPYELSAKGMQGIGWRYGDLQDLVHLLVSDPYTRQAWIPLFFPEDTGVGDGDRKPCTLGYQLTRRGERLNIWYPLRSCDLVRHFQDDCYLAVRLLLWILDRCRELDSLNDTGWHDVRPGTYAMHMTSLHVFENDRRAL